MAKKSNVDFLIQLHSEIFASIYLIANFAKVIVQCVYPVHRPSLLITMAALAPLCCVLLSDVSDPEM